MFDVSNAHASGEHDLADIAKTGTVDDYRLVRHDLRREERLDAQSGRVRIDDFLGGTCRERAQKGDGQQYSEIVDYLLHN